MAGEYSSLPADAYGFNSNSYMLGGLCILSEVISRFLDWKEFNSPMSRDFGCGESGYLSFHVDYLQEQEMEIEALQAILMDDIKEIDPTESGLNVTNQCFQIIIPLQDDDADDSASIPVQLALIFAHSEKYPDEPPFLNVRSLRGIKPEDLKSLKEKLDQEASENLGMAMVYTLVTSAKEWLIEKYGGDSQEEDEEKDTEKDEIIIPHGEPVTVDTFLAWRERFEAELALERAKLMPDSALSVPKEKKLAGRQWFESGRASAKGAAPVTEDSEEEDEEDIDFDDDFEVDEEDMLEHYLAERSEGSAHGSRS